MNEKTQTDRYGPKLMPQIQSLSHAICEFYYDPGFGENCLLYYIYLPTNLLNTHLIYFLLSSLQQTNHILIHLLDNTLIMSDY